MGQPLRPRSGPGACPFVAPAVSATRTTPMTTRAKCRGRGAAARLRGLVSIGGRHAAGVYPCRRLRLLKRRAPSCLRRAGCRTLTRPLVAGLSPNTRLLWQSQMARRYGLRPHAQEALPLTRLRWRRTFGACHCSGELKTGWQHGEGHRRMRRMLRGLSRVRYRLALPLVRFFLAPGRRDVDEWNAMEMAWGNGHIAFRSGAFASERWRSSGAASTASRE